MKDATDWLRINWWTLAVAFGTVIVTVYVNSDRLARANERITQLESDIKVIYEIAEDVSAINERTTYLSSDVEIIKGDIKKIFLEVK